MNRNEYIEKYKHLTYTEMTKAELIACIEELIDTLKNCGIEFMKPSGDAWDYRDEIDRWCNISFHRCENLGYGNFIKHKKSALIDYAVALDMACSSLFEVNGEHPCHKFEREFFAKRNSRKKRG